MATAVPVRWRGDRRLNRCGPFAPCRHRNRPPICATIAITRTRGPAFGYLKSAHPRASDAEIKHAIIAVVRFEDACFKYFVQDSTDYRERCVRAVARAAKESPFYLESTYRQARNDVAYYIK
jgi:hypothetical protein